MSTTYIFDFGLFIAFTCLLLILAYDLFTQVYPTSHSYRKIVTLLTQHHIALLSALFIGSFFIYWVCGRHSFNVYNNFSYLADALLHGHLSVPDLPAYLESVSFKGYQYMHFAPGPSILSLPFVLIFGVDKFNCSILAMLLGACNTLLAYKLLTNLELQTRIRNYVWLTAMLTFGTVHFFCASLGSSWFLGHAATLFCLLVAMVFLTAKTPARPMLTIFFSGLFFGLAVTCRLSTLFGCVFFIGFLYLKYKKDYRYLLKLLICFACGAAIFGFLYMLYNFVRYGTIMDMGYNLTYLKDYHREAYDALLTLPANEQLSALRSYEAEFGGPLQLRFVRQNLYSIFFLLPAFQSVYPFVVPTMSGVAITFTSPMLYYGIRAKIQNPLTIVLWITTFLTAVPFLLNYGNGMAQFGMRYSMDFTPYLWLLMCMGLSRKHSLRFWQKTGIAVCIFIQFWGNLYWTVFY